MQVVPLGVALGSTQVIQTVDVQFAHLELHARQVDTPLS